MKISLRFSVCLAACSLLAAMAGCHKKAEDAPEPVVTVQAQHPTIGPIAPEIAADAVLAPLAQAAIAPRVSAPISRELVQRGAHVRKDQLLVTLENRDLRGAALDSKGNLTQAQAAYTSATQAVIPEDLQKAQLDLAQAKANLEVANRTADERKRLLAQGAIAGREVDLAVASAVQAQAAFDTASQHLANAQKTTQQTSTESAKGQLASAQGKYQSAEAQVSYTELRSPIDGVVTDRPLFPGETAAAGAPVITVMDTSSLLAKLHIAQAAAQQLKVGGTAELKIPGIEEAQTASISLISPALDPGSTTVEIWLKLANPHSLYKVGTPVHAIIHGASVPNAVKIPAGALLPTDSGSTNVLVIAGDNTVQKRAVTVGVRTSDEVQLLSGVTAADMVVTEGGYGLDNGTKVKIGAPGQKDDDAEDKTKPDAGKPDSDPGKADSKQGDKK